MSDANQNQPIEEQQIPEYMKSLGLEYCWSPDARKFTVTVSKGGPITPEEVCRAFQSFWVLFTKNFMEREGSEQ